MEKTTEKCVYIPFELTNFVKEYITFSIWVVTRWKKCIKHWIMNSKQNEASLNYDWKLFLKRHQSTMCTRRLFLVLVLVLNKPEHWHLFLSFTRYAGTCTCILAIRTNCAHLNDFLATITPTHTNTTR